MLNRLFSENILFINFKFQPLITLIEDYIWLKFQVIIFICFREKKIFLKISAFSFSDDNRSKSQPIALKFGTDIFFISSNRVRYPKKSVHYDQRYLRLIIFFKYCWIAFSQRIFYLSTLNFNHLLHSSKTIFG